MVLVTLILFQALYTAPQPLFSAGVAQLRHCPKKALWAILVPLNGNFGCGVAEIRAAFFAVVFNHFLPAS
jgi:hypothetical protein